MTQKTKLPVWYLPGPFYRYEQDVKAEAAKADGGGDQPLSQGMTVEQLKDALAVRGVQIPEGVTLKADLAALLDAQPE